MNILMAMAAGAALAMIVEHKLLPVIKSKLGK